MVRFSFQRLAETLAVPNVGMGSGGACTVQANSSSSVSPSSSSTVTVAVPMPAAVGVPETTRSAAIVTPAGRSVAE